MILNAAKMTDCKKIFVRAGASLMWNDSVHVDIGKNLNNNHIIYIIKHYQL